jgi:predicted dithiol-disulfide oxidoreductase (DUF899 family)
VDVTFPGESAEYRAARNELLAREIDLRRQTEAVAAARRELPPGGPVPEDFVLQGEGPEGKVVAKSPLDRLVTWKRERGWRRLRLLSSANNTYNRDYLAETPEGVQRPMLNVFHRDGKAIRHFWGSELFYGPWDPGQDPRHVGTLEPLWNLFDLTPEGRPDWHEQLSYE